MLNLISVKHIINFVFTINVIDLFENGTHSNYIILFYVNTCYSTLYFSDLNSHTSYASKDIQSEYQYASNDLQSFIMLELHLLEYACTYGIYSMNMYATRLKTNLNYNDKDHSFLK